MKEYKVIVQIEVKHVEAKDESEALSKALDYVGDHLIDNAYAMYAEEEAEGEK